MKPFAVLAALVLLLAGCSAEVGPGPADPTASTSAAPAPGGSPAQARPSDGRSTTSGCPVPEAVEHPERLRGVNVAGGEFTHTVAGLPGVQGTHYLYPGPRFLSYLASRGHCLVRLPFRWERVQPQLSGALSESGLAELRAAVDAAADAGLLVLLDLHNYGAYVGPDDVERRLGDGVTPEDLRDLWTRLVAELEDQPAVVAWGLMNEPNGLADPSTGPTTWQVASQAAVDGIRATGDERTVFVAGDQWGGAKGWAGKNGDPWIEDPADDVVYEAHYYFDEDNSGLYATSYAELDEDAVERGHADLHARITDELDDFVEWLEVHDRRGFIGEVGWPHGEDEALWNGAGAHTYTVLDAAGIGATFWATGEYWAEDYPLNAYDHEALTSRAQATVIERHLVVPTEDDRS
jgi:endoglucanase